MTDPFMLDQRDVELSLERLQDAVSAWRTLRGAPHFTDTMEYQLQGLDGSIRNGIRDAKWSLDELGDTLRLLTEHEAHFADSESARQDLNSRRAFLESARKTLASIELEILAPASKGGEGGEKLPLDDDEEEEEVEEEEENESEHQPCMDPQATPRDRKDSSNYNGKMKMKKMKKMEKTVSWHRHVRESLSVTNNDDGEVRVVGKAVWLASRPMARRIAEGLMKYRLWISMAVAVALFVLVLLVVSVSKASRVQQQLQGGAQAAVAGSTVRAAADAAAPSAASTVAATKYRWHWG